MDFTNIPTADICRAVAAEPRDRGVPYALLVSLDDSIQLYMPSHVSGEVDRAAQRLFSTIRNTVGGDEWNETRIPRDAPNPGGSDAK